MRNLQKLGKPPILQQNEATWLSDFLMDVRNATKKYRYRDPDIKDQLTKETNYKCVYCESKIGHNTPGDIEHKIPSSKAPELHFTWSNLTIACNECNRRKNDYYEVGNAFVDPYVDDVETMIEHLGPFVSWQVGNGRAETSIRQLQLNSAERLQIILRKMAKLDELGNCVERYHAEADPLLRQLLKRQLFDMASSAGEYSAMVLSALKARGIFEG